MEVTKQSRAVSFVFGLAGTGALTPHAVNPKHATTTTNHARHRQLGSRCRM